MRFLKRSRTALFAGLVTAWSIPTALLLNIVSNQVPAGLAKSKAALGLLRIAAILSICLAVWQVNAGRREADSGADERSLRERKQMLWLVSVSADARLAQTFLGVPRMPLSLIERPELVRSPKPVADLPAGRSPGRRHHDEDLLAIFERAGRSMLLAGDGGSGKSALLARLCTQLCRRELAGTGPPTVPVLVDLSSWKEGDTRVDAWLCRAVAETYTVSRELVRDWLDRGAVLPLLDGLDAVTPALRDRAMRALQDYLSEHPISVAVCCRTQDYKKLRTLLPLGGGIEIQSPERLQVIEYLEAPRYRCGALGRSCTSQRPCLVVDDAESAHAGHRGAHLRGEPESAANGPWIGASATTANHQGLRGFTP